LKKRLVHFALLKNINVALQQMLQFINKHGQGAAHMLQIIYICFWSNGSNTNYLCCRATAKNTPAVPHSPRLNAFKVALKANLTRVKCAQQTFNSKLPKH
jgi:hypothetical protein